MNGTEQKERHTALEGLRAEVRTLMEAYATEWDQTVGEINERITKATTESADIRVDSAAAMSAHDEKVSAQLAGVRDEFAGLLDTEREQSQTDNDEIVVAWSADWDVLRRGFWGRLKWLLTGK